MAIDRTHFEKQAQKSGKLEKEQQLTEKPPQKTKSSKGRRDNFRKNKSPEELLLATAMADETGNQEENIRPQRLADYIGQKDLKAVLSIAIQAAKVRNESMDHLLLYGPPGLGKTTMSLIFATELGVNCKITAAPALERQRDIMGILCSLEGGDVLSRGGAGGEERGTAGRRRLRKWPPSSGSRRGDARPCAPRYAVYGRRSSCRRHSRAFQPSAP